MNTNKITDRLNALRQRMRDEGIQLYIVSDTDFHLSPDPCDYFQTLRYISGFSGNCARMVITETNAHLWTTEEFRQLAETELAGTEITLHIVGDAADDINSLPLFFAASGDAIIDGMVGEITELGHPQQYVGFDGRTFSYDEIDELIESLGFVYDAKIVAFNAGLDLIGDIWADRPGLPAGPVTMLDMAYAGESVRSKLDKVQEDLASYGASTGAVLTMLDDISWLFNLRANDQPYSMAVLSYAYISVNEAWLFIDSGKVPDAVRRALTEAGVTLREYDEFYSFLEGVTQTEILLDGFRNNFAVVVTIHELPGAFMTLREGLVELQKAMRNETERKNALEVHLKDAIAVTRFLYWLHQHAGEGVTEGQAAEALWSYQKEQNAIRPAMLTWSAYGANAANPQYLISDGGVPLPREGIYSIRAGAHYLGGTTCMARTVSLGTASDEAKRAYTGVLRCLLAGADLKFPEGLFDAQIDAIIRQPLWKMGIDYGHPTGQGTGMMLYAQEDPQFLDWRKRGMPAPIRETMVTSIGPGCYAEGYFGVRLENEYVCAPVFNQAGFLQFAALTFVPFDTRLVNVDMLSEEELHQLNVYQGLVYMMISPFLSDEEGQWLEKETRPLFK